jgi:hypothetical protein
VGSDEELPYEEQLAHCKRMVQHFLTALFADRGARGIPWAAAQDPPEHPGVDRPACQITGRNAQPSRQGSGVGMGEL